jgi:hypothetical protein
MKANKGEIINGPHNRFGKRAAHRSGNLSSATKRAMEERKLDRLVVVSWKDRASSELDLP